MRWVTQQLLEHLFKGSVLLNPEQFEERKQICQGCDRFGNVEPIPYLILPGCLECGCPLDTKGKMKSFLRLEENLGTSVTMLELINAIRSDDNQYIRETVTCDLHKWPSIS